MGYTEDDIREIVQKQRNFFKTGKTLNVEYRIRQLKRLKAALIANEEAFEKALHEDLGRSRIEAYLCDIGPVIVEINEIIKGLKKWAT